MSVPSKTTQVLAVVGSLHQESVTRVVIREIAQRLTTRGCQVDTLDLLEEPLALYSPDTAYEAPGFPLLKSRVEAANIFILGTPDYHGSISSTLKNFLDHFWKEFAGKLFVPVVASHEKGLTVIDQLRTVARQCYAWAMPYAFSFSEGSDIADGKIVTHRMEPRLEMLCRDVATYGQLLAAQRAQDLTGTDVGFMAKHRE